MRITALILFLYSSFFVTAQANEENKLCVSEFQVDKAVCLSNFDGTKRASCMRTATRNKKICLAGGELNIEVGLVPATMEDISFEELGLPEDTKVIGSHSSNLDNGLPEVEVRGRFLAIGTPDDTGRDEVYRIKLSSPSVAKMTLILKVSTRRPIDTWRYDDGPEDESDEEGDFAPEAPELIVKGLDKYNIIGTSDLSLSINLPRALSLSHSDLDIIDNKGNRTRVNDEFTFDPDTNTFTASGVVLSAIMDQMQGQEFTFSTNLATDDLEIALNYSFIILNPTVTLTGQLVDVSGNPLSGKAIDDLNISIVGEDSDIRRVVPVDKKGQFIVPGLIEETYTLDVMDLQRSGLDGGYAVIYSGTTEAHKDIIYEGLEIETTQKKSNLAGKQNGEQSGFATIQNGRLPIGRDPLVLSQQSKSDITLLAASAPNTGCPRIVGADTYYIINSRVEDKEMFCKVNYTASETAAEIMLEVLGSRYFCKSLFWASQPKQAAKT